MARQPEKTGRLDPLAVKLLRIRLRAIDGILRTAEESGEIYTFKIPSLTTGIEKLEAATIEITKSLQAKANGEPYDESTKKGPKNAN